ncbi:MAG TPA: type II secretion system major pseudopilin GspG [Rhodanobacteraceae bacterium]|nr:type II secretion system major pseudopilin GspG [Rhodanobacteraceae bacterium]
MTRNPNAPLAPRPSPLAPAKGFTLLEMLAVIVLIGIIGTIVVTQVGKNMQKGKYGAGKAQLITLGQKIQNYALDNGAPPKSLQALLTKPAGDTNWLGPYAKPSDLKDPWGHAFGYKYPGDHGMFDLTFYGQDGKPGGDGFSKDVGNWQ